MSPQTGVPRPTRKDGPEHRGRNFVSYIFLENSAQEAQEALGRNRKQKLRCKQQDIAAPSLIRLLFFGRCAISRNQRVIWVPVSFPSRSAFWASG